MGALNPSPVCTAARLTGVPIRIRIAASVSSPLARRGGGRIRSASALLLTQFRSVALAGADLIAGARLAGLSRLGARVERVFAVLNLIGVGQLHAQKIGMEKVGDVRKVVGEFRRV